MFPFASTPLFLLGLASGVALLPIASYRHASPAWLKWLLIASGVALISRYNLIAAWVDPTWRASLPPWIVRSCWMARFVGFTLPAAFAIDQLIRHPAMTPQRLLRGYAPFALAAGAGLAIPGPAIIIVQLIFLVGFTGLCLVLIRKIPSTPIRRALVSLAMAYGYLAGDALTAALSQSSALFLLPELAALVALWYAYETSADLQRSS